MSRNKFTPLIGLDLNEEIQTAFRDYFNGSVDYDTALDNFYTAAIEKYPDLKRPE